MSSTLNLSLRQKKLLHLLQGMEGYITGSALARQLNVSPRTIRTDIAEINRALAPFQAQILSERSKGYLYYASDPKALEGVTQSDYAFFTTEERVRYLAFRLCLSDKPLNLYDLEDEMFISHTTLEHDLRQLRIQYVLSDPKITFLQDHDSFSFEQDEKKRRSILNRLFREDWNYQTRNNAYYGYHFLDANLLNEIMDELPLHLVRHGIFMEDPSLVSLNLAIAIMYHRVTSGHPLPEEELPERKNPAVSQATDELFLALEEKLHCSFAPQEREDIYERILSGCLPESMYRKAACGENETQSCPKSRKEEAAVNETPASFPPLTQELADAYLKKIKGTFGLDFRSDEDFTLTLLSYLQYLQIPGRIFNAQGNHDIDKEQLLTEYEIADLFQDLALAYLGSYVTETELLYLAHCISGALESYTQLHPENKLKTVICCHLNMPAAWALKRRVLGAFGNYLTVTALLPVNSKNTYDFRDTDLILSTVKKRITDSPSTELLRIDPYLPTKDCLAISACLKDAKIRRLFPAPRDFLKDLLTGACWHEKEPPISRFDVIETLCGDFLKEGIVGQEYVSDLLRRESVSTFAVRPGLVFMHSLVPAKETRLSVMTFDHRIIWNTHKIRTVIAGAFRPQDAPLLIRLKHIFYDASLDIESFKMLREKKEIIAFFER